MKTKTKNHRPRPDVATALGLSTGEVIVESPDARTIEAITRVERQLSAMRTEIGAMASTIALLVSTITTKK